MTTRCTCEPGICFCVPESWDVEEPSTWADPWAQPIRDIREAFINAGATLAKGFSKSFVGFTKAVEQAKEELQAVAEAADDLVEDLAEAHDACMRHDAAIRAWRSVPGPLALASVHRSHPGPELRETRDIPP